VLCVQSAMLSGTLRYPTLVTSPGRRPGWARRRRRPTSLAQGPRLAAARRLRGDTAPGAPPPPPGAQPPPSDAASTSQLAGTPRHRRSGSATQAGSSRVLVHYPLAVNVLRSAKKTGTLLLLLAVPCIHLPQPSLANVQLHCILASTCPPSICCRLKTARRHACLGPHGASPMCCGAHAGDVPDFTMHLPLCDATSTNELCTRAGNFLLQHAKRGCIWSYSTPTSP